MGERGQPGRWLAVPDPYLRAPVLRVHAGTEPAPDRVDNEDHVFHAGGLVGVLDGATVPEGFDTGCVHGPAWYVRHLAARLALAVASRPTATLTGSLAAAILTVRADHGGRCDLDHRGTPSATVCLLRQAGEHLDYLVLCDSPLVVDRGGRVEVVTDDRLAVAVAASRHPGPDDDPTDGFRRAVTRQREWMNRIDGYWVAAADPDAAWHAVTGVLPLTGPDRVRRAALLTDGAACAVDGYGLFDWRGLLDVLTYHGPGELIRRVRAAEHHGPPPGRRKRHDDATAALCLFDH
jgi:hypothetical protein